MKVILNIPFFGNTESFLHKEIKTDSKQQTQFQVITVV